MIMTLWMLYIIYLSPSLCNLDYLLHHLISFLLFLPYYVLFSILPFLPFISITPLLPHDADTTLLFFNPLLRCITLCFTIINLTFVAIFMSFFV